MVLDQSLFWKNNATPPPIPPADEASMIYRLTHARREHALPPASDIKVPRLLSKQVTPCSKHETHIGGNRRCPEQTSGCSTLLIEKKNTT